MAKRKYFILTPGELKEVLGVKEFERVKIQMDRNQKLRDRHLEWGKRKKISTLMNQDHIEEEPPTPPDSVHEEEEGVRL